MRNFVATKNEGENIHSPPMWVEVLPHWNIYTAKFHETVSLFNNELPNCFGILNT